MTVTTVVKEKIIPVIPEYIKQEKVFVTDDGAEFEKYSEAVRHENVLTVTPIVNKIPKVHDWYFVETMYEISLILTFITNGITDVMVEVQNNLPLWIKVVEIDIWGDYKDTAYLEELTINELVTMVEIWKTN